MNIGRRRRRWSASRVCWNEMTVSRLAVDEITMSASARWSGASSREMAYAPSTVAMRRACSTVRFAITMRPTGLDARWRAQSSTVSPAPTSRAVRASRSPKIRWARVTAA